MSEWLVSTDWLAERLANTGIFVLDCSWYLPSAGKAGIDDFRQRHIPGARFLDLMAVEDRDSPYVNMLPPAEQWARVIGGLGISNETTVVVYDAGYVSARVWWMFRTFGHDRVRILDGGLRKWLADGRPVEAGDPAPACPVPFRAETRAGRVASFDDMQQAVGQGGVTIVDARTAARFDGHEASGYPGVPSGYMPGAINTPWARFFDPDRQHVFVGPEAAARVFAEAGADLTRPVIATCGSGVTAAILGFMLERAGHSDWRLYDGSWHEWGQRPETPKLVKPLPGDPKAAGG